MQDPTQTLFTLLEETDFRKYLVGVIAIIVLPSIFNFVISLLKGKNITKLANIVKESNQQYYTDREYLLHVVDNLYQANFIEGTASQLMFTFKNRAVHDRELLVTGTARIIKLNNIANKEIAKHRIKVLVNNTFNATKAEFNCFELKTVSVGEYFKEEWSMYCRVAIEDFIYNDRFEDGEGNYTYNYDILRSRLISQFETIILEFSQIINNS